MPPAGINFRIRASGITAVLDASTAKRWSQSARFCSSRLASQCASQSAPSARFDFARTRPPSTAYEFIETIKNEVLPILKKQVAFLEILPLFPEMKDEKAVYIALWAEKRDAKSGITKKCSPEWKGSSNRS